MAAPGPPDPGAVATAACPVPPAQRPLEQYRELANSWFFAWPHASFASLLRPLAVCWLLLLPGAWLVASGSVALRHDPPRLVAAGAVAALVLPLLLLTRQWLGWTSIQRRQETCDFDLEWCQQIASAVTRLGPPEVLEG